MQPMRSIHSLAWRNLASRRLRTFLTGMAIALGVAAVFATSMIGQAMQTSTASLAARISGADLQITPRDGDTLDARWLDVVRAQPDVALASPEIMYSAVLLDPPGASLMILGVEPETYWALERPEMANGRALTTKQKQTIVLPERWGEEHRVHVGGRLMVSMDSGALPSDPSPLEMLIVGIIQRRDDAGAVLRDRMALVPLTTLQDALGLHRQLSRIRLSLQPGRDPARVEATLASDLARHPLAQDGPVVVSKAEVSSGSFTLYGMLTGGLALAGAVTLWAAALLITNTFAINMTERTRQIGILRALGMSQGDVLRGVLAEAVGLGAIGSLVGLPLGWGLAQAIVRVLVAWQRVEFEQLSLSAAGLIVAPVIGMSVALVAALWPARRAAQVSPLAAIHPQRVDGTEQDLPETWILGVLLGVAALVVTVWASTAAGTHTLNVNSAIMLCMLMPLVTLVSALLILPLLVTGLAELSRRLLSNRLGVVGRLAGDQLVRRRQRTLLTVGTLTLGLAMIMLMSSTGGALIRVGGEMLFGLMKEDFMLMPFSPDESLESTSLLSPQRQQEWPRAVLALLDSVRDRAFVYSMGFATPIKEMEGNSAPNIIVIDDLEAFLQVGSLRYEQGDLDTALRIMRQGRGVLITPAVARQFDLQVGSEWTLSTRRGRVPFHVAAVALTPFWAPIISRADAETYLGASVPFGYFVTAKLDGDRELVRSRLQDELQAFPHYKLFDMGPDSELTQLSIGRVWNTLTVLLNALTALALIIATVGQTNTIMASVIERVREMGVLRSVGLTRRQVQWLVLLEAACVGEIGAVTGILLGAASALTMLMISSTAVVASGGLSVPTWSSVMGSILAALASVRWLALAGCLLSPLVTMLAAWLPARRAAALSILQVIRDV
jgi:putative ABC transport system permease protein